MKSFKLIKKLRLLRRSNRLLQFQLETERELFHSILSQLPSGVIVSTTPGNQILFSNDKLEEIWRHPEPNRWRGFHADGSPYQEEEWPLAQTLSEGKVIKNKIIQILRGDGSPGVLRMSSAPVNNQQGKQIAGVLICEDFTERARVEATLKATEERLQTIITNSPVILFTLDQNGICTYCDGKGLQSLLLKPQHVVSLSAFHLFRETPWIIEGLKEALSGTTVSMEGQVGQAFYEVHITPHMNSKNQVSGVIGLALDITARKKAETTRIKSEFLSQMSHEIRTPLNGIIGIIHLVLGESMSPVLQDYFETIQKSANMLLSVINNILDISKVESGKMTLETIEFDLEQTILDTVKMLMPSATQKSLQLKTSFTPNLLFLLKGDPGKIKQVMVNLIANAIKFTSKGEVNVQVQSEFNPDQSVHVKIEIQDSGIGIPKEIQKEIFKPYIQANTSTSRQYGGTGLGLSICKQLVELMGGTLRVESTPGVGSSFSFELLLKHGALKSLPKKDSSILLQPLQSHSERILVAEDNPINQKVAMNMLQKLGYSAEAVANGNEVLDALKLHQYDLILMDCQMPELDGYQASIQIRNRTDLNHTQVPIIAMTANGFKGDEENCYTAGMNDYVTKPFPIAVLSEILEKWLKFKQLKSQSG